MRTVTTFALALAAVAPLAALAQPSPSPSTTGPTTLSVATLAPVGSPWMRVFDAWNRELRRRSSGRINLRFYPNGVQGDESDVVRKIRTGRLDGSALTAVGLAQIHRPTVAFQLPGLFDTDAQLDHARTALRTELDAAYARAGFTLLGWGDAGTDRFFSTRAILAPADLQATKPFVWRDDPILPAIVAETHAQGQVMQIGDVLPALQLGTVDTLCASPIGVASLQWAAHVTHMTDLPAGVEVGALVFARTAMERLAPADRALMTETARTYSELIVRNVRRDDTGMIPRMRARGLTVDTPDAAQRAQWEALFTRTRARLAADLGGTAWIERIRAAR